MYSLADKFEEAQREVCYREEDRPPRDRPHTHRPLRERYLSPNFVYRPSRRVIFNALVAAWREEAAYESMTHRVAMSPAYQAMVGMGREALPLIFEGLSEDPSPHWLWALRAITRQDPAAGTTTVADAAAAWLEWGRASGYAPA